MTEEDFENFQLDDTNYKTRLTNAFKTKQKWEKPDDKKIKSLIPGTVLDVYVEEGKKVNEGDKLLSYEAMKMRNTVYAPISGKVSKVNVSPGGTFSKNVLLVELE